MPWQEYWFELATMAALVAASAFFSGSEAALFSITRSERAAMAGGSARDRRAASLLRRPERLLTAILFWNLVVNLVYYALTEVVAMRLGRAEGVSPWAPNRWNDPHGCRCPVETRESPWLAKSLIFWKSIRHT